MITVSIATYVFVLVVTFAAGIVTVLEFQRVKRSKKCTCPPGMRFHALNCPYSPGKKQ